MIPALQELQKEANFPNPFDNTAEYFTSGLEKKKEYIVLGDLKPQGYILHDKKKCLDKEHLEFIFRTYGKFHALSFVLRKQHFEKYKEIHQDYTDLFPTLASVNLFTDAISSAIETVDSESPTFEVAQYITQNVTEMLLKVFEYNGEYRCSTHGDCWSNNMLFRYSDSGKLEDIKLVDFQLARDGTPVHDLSYFFYSGAAKDDFDVLEDYLRIYHNSFSEMVRSFGENPEEIFPFETLIKEWKENALLGVFLGIYVWQVKLTAKEDFVDTLKGGDTKEGENGQMSLDERTKMIAELIAKTSTGDLYQQKTRAILTHAFEYGILRKEKLVVLEREATPENAGTEL